MNNGRFYGQYERKNKRRQNRDENVDDTPSTPSTSTGRPTRQLSVRQSRQKTNDVTTSQSGTTAKRPRLVSHESSDEEQRPEQETLVISSQNGQRCGKRGRPGKNQNVSSISSDEVSEGADFVQMGETNAVTDMNLDDRSNEPQIDEHDFEGF